MADLLRELLAEVKHLREDVAALGRVAADSKRTVKIESGRQDTIPVPEEWGPIVETLREMGWG